MMRRHSDLIAVAFGLAVLASVASAVDQQFRTLDLARKTLHEPYLKGAAGGPVKAFFLSPANQTLGHVREIAQRGDFEVRYAAISVKPKDELDKAEVTAALAQVKQDRPAVLVVMALDGEKHLGKDVVDDIFKQVQAGMGLVTFAQERDLKDQPSLAKYLTAQAEVKEDALPASAVPMPPVRRFQVGQGRVALLVSQMVMYRDTFRFMRTWPTLQTGVKESATVEEFRWRGFEYAYAWLGQMAQWAARRDSRVCITQAALAEDAVTVSLANAGEKRTGAQLAVTVRNRRWEARATGKTAVELAAGVSEVKVPLSEPPEGGALALEMSLRDAAGKLLAFASKGVASPTPVTLKFTPSALYPTEGDPIELSLELARQGTAPVLPEKGRLTVSVTDRFGRLVYRATGDVAPAGKGATPLKAALPAWKTRCVYHEVVAGLWTEEKDRQRLLAQGAADLNILPKKPPYDEAFHLGMWGAPERDALHIQALVPVTVEAGILLCSHGYYDPLIYASGACKTGTARAPYPVGRWSDETDRFASKDEKATVDPKTLILSPPLVPSAEAVERAKAQWQRPARKAAETGARFIRIRDEAMVSVDYDYSPQTLAAFRQWLEKRHGTVQALNKAWGATFASFNAVMPSKRTELPGWPYTRNLAPWLEFRLFFAEVVAEYYMRLPAEWAAEIHPDLAVGEDGIYVPNGDTRSWPVDWSRCAKHYRRTCRYTPMRDLLGDYFRSFAPESVTGPWVGYNLIEISPTKRVEPWQTLLNGGRWCNYWQWRDDGKMNYGVATSDQRLVNAYAALAADEFPDLTGGLDRMIIASRFSDDGVALAYSFPSILCNPDALVFRLRDSIKELGFQYTFITMDDIAAGRLEKEGYRLLVLEDTSCISAEQAEGVRRFVTGGGALLAIGRNGQYDARGCPVAKNVLDELAGIDTSNSQHAVDVVEAKTQDGILTTCLAWKGVRVTKAAALASASVGTPPATVPVFAHVKQGRGQVYWFNSSFFAQWKQTNEVKQKLEPSNDLVLSPVFAAAGLRPRCAFFKDGKPFSDYRSEVWYWQSPSKRSLYVGRYVLNDVGALDVRFDRASHLYDMRAHKYLGKTDKVREEYKAGRVRVYGLLDYKVEGVQVAVSPASVKPGGCARLTCAVRTDGNPADLHALRVAVAGPDGKGLAAYQGAHLAREGRLEIELPMALDALKGRHMVTAMDVVSGQTGQAVFEVSGDAAPAELALRP